MYSIYCIYLYTAYSILNIYVFIYSFHPLSRKKKSLRSYRSDSIAAKSDGTLRSESSIWSSEILITTQGLRMLKLKTEFHKFLRSSDLTSILINRSRLHVNKLLAVINKMEMYSGSVRTSMKYFHVNVQVLHCMKMDEENKSVLSSVKELRNLKHPNIQVAIGACIDILGDTRDGFQLLLITTERIHKHVTLKRLLEWALSNNSSLLTQHCALNFIIDICKGVNYLEEKHLTGFDLTTSTCL